jgi:transcription antitermination factor NusG
MIAACLGIDHLLPAKSEWPVPVREQAMQAFLDQAEIFSTPPMVEAAPVLDRPQLPWFSKDEILSINSGPWVGHTGTFVRVKEGTVELKMQLFNRDINVWFEGRQIEQRM